MGRPGVRNRGRRVKIGHRAAEETTMRSTPTIAITTQFAGRELDSLGYIVRAYDRAIDACERADRRGARQALGVLREGLALDSPVSVGFDALYTWCLDAIDEDDFASPARCLRTLRDAWCRAADPAAIFPAGKLPVS